jgi:serine/threonine protein kinase
VSRLTPTAVSDALLLALVSTDAEALQLAAGRGQTHVAVLEFARGSVVCLELDSSMADAVVARLALLASLDFTARDERYAAFQTRCNGSVHQLSLSVRPGDGHLGAYLRKVSAASQVVLRSSASAKIPETIGDYRIVEELGRGALGVVLRAEHQLLKKPAAIKLWSLPNTQTAKANAALLREARAASATRHPGVVDVYDILRLPDGRIAMVMELLEGQSLGVKLARDGAFEPSEAVRVARAIADVLEATHAAGIIHRDLKPENVFLLRDGRIKVLDFGAALSDSKPNEKAGTLGTPWYMAPEQALGNRPDRRADVYSLGCVLFEMLTGNCPFDSSDARVVMAKHLEDPVPTPESPFGPLPEALERCVMRALAKPPDQRQQSASELARELEQASSTMTRPGWRKWLAL